MSMNSELLTVSAIYLLGVAARRPQAPADLSARYAEAYRSMIEREIEKLLWSELERCPVATQPLGRSPWSASTPSPTPAACASTLVQC